MGTRSSVCYVEDVRRRLFAFFVGVLLVPLLLVSAGPGLARAIAGVAPHVCRCDAAHTDCVCTICHSDSDETSARATMKGVCGDQDVAFAAWHVAGVLPRAASVVVAASARPLSPITVARLDGRALAPPEPPPPRA